MVHRLGVAPRWQGIVEIDDFRGAGGLAIRRIATSDYQDLSWGVHDGRAIVTPAVVAGGDRKPTPLACGIQVRAFLQLTRIKHKSVRRHEGAGVIWKCASGAGE